MTEAGPYLEAATAPVTPEARVDAHWNRLLELKQSSALVDGDVARALPLVTELGAALLDVGRVSVWHLRPDGQVLECVHCFSPAEGHGRGGSLEASAHPEYFAALRNERALAVADASRDPRTRALGAHGAAAGARLDVPVLLRGQWVGVISHEYLGGARVFSPCEQYLAVSLADFVAQVLLVREQLRVEVQLRQLRARVDDLLESRTSEVVRENADLQREVDALQVATETMRRSEDERRKLFAASPVPMLLVRREDQQVLFVNDQCAHALRCSAFELAGRQLRDLFMHAAEFQAIWSKLVQGGQEDGREVTLRAESGEAFWALVSAHNVEFHDEQAVLLGFTDLTAQKAVEHQLRVLAQRDPLTQAYNRHHFWQIAHSEMGRVRRYQRPLSLAVVDADYFKAINDQYGHDVGDRVLRSIVDTCHEGLRASDVLARWGGEEFVVLLPETSREGAEVVMERLRARIETTPVVLDDDREVRVTVSVGLTALRDTDHNFEAMFKRADDALYAAKRRGRNRVELG